MTTFWILATEITALFGVVWFGHKAMVSDYSRLDDSPARAMPNRFGRRTSDD